LSLLAQTHRFEFPVRIMKDDRGWGFIDLTGFDTDKTVLNVVNPANAMLSAKAVKLLD
jgi:hypothetical protein